MPTQLRGEAARQRLLDVADRLFYDSGVQAVGVDAVVAESGMAKSTLYRWFPTKDDLVAAYLARRDAAFWEVWDAVAEQHRGNGAIQELRAQLRWIEDWIADPASRGCPFLNCAAELAEPAEAVREATLRNKHELRARLVELTTRIAGEGRAEALADHVHLLIDGAFATSEVFGDAGPHRRLTESAMTVLEAQGESGRL